MQFYRASSKPLRIGNEPSLLTTPNPMHPTTLRRFQGHLLTSCGTKQIGDFIERTAPISVAS